MSERMRNHKLQNWIASMLLLIGMAALLGLVGWILAGMTGLAIAVGLGFVLTASATSPSRLTMKFMGARPLHPGQAPELAMMMRELSQRAELPRVPTLYLIPSHERNAFATGRRKRDPAVAVTYGLLQTLNLREIRGVLAHEISHLRHNDVFVMHMASITGRLTWHFVLFGQILLFLSLPMVLFGLAQPPWLLIAVLLVTPMVSLALQSALSRTREFSADLSAAELSRDPIGLAGALNKLERAAQPPWRRWFLPKKQDSGPTWLRSHPPTEERVARLRFYAGPNTVHPPTSLNPGPVMFNRREPLLHFLLG